VITLFGALSNAEIASIIPETGGQYVYFDRIFGPFSAFLYGWAALRSCKPASIAAVGYVFANTPATSFPCPNSRLPIATWTIHLRYIGDVAPFFKEIGTKWLAAALIILLTAINYIGVGWRLISKTFLLSPRSRPWLVILGAFCCRRVARRQPRLEPHDSSSRPGAGGSHCFRPPGRSGRMTLNKVTYIAGEVKDRSGISRSAAVRGACSIVTAIYLLMNPGVCLRLPIRRPWRKSKVSWRRMWPKNGFRGRRAVGSRLP